MLCEAYGVGSNYPHFKSTRSLIECPNRRSLPLVMGHVHYDAIQTLCTGPKVVTILREPIERTISAFEYAKSQPSTWLGKLAQGTLADFLLAPGVSASRRDLQTKLLGLEINFRGLYAQRAKNSIDLSQYLVRITEACNKPADDRALEVALERMQNLDFVAFTDSFDDDVIKLFQVLGKPCPPVARINETPQQFRQRGRYTEKDMKLVADLNSRDIELYAFAKKHWGTR
jgi:hypothetical protein